MTTVEDIVALIISHGKLNEMNLSIKIGNKLYDVNDYYFTASDRLILTFDEKSEKEI